MEAVQSTIINLVQWLRLGVEATGALVIAVGVVISIHGFGRSLARHQLENYVEVRLTLARYLALAIEFELAADILSTAIAPSRD